MGSFYCFIMLLIVAVAITLGAIGITVYEILARINLRNDPKFGLNSLSVSNLNISGSEISGIWDVEFLAKSPDFLYTNNYPQPTVSIYYENQQLLLEEFLPGIHVPKMKTISYRVNPLAMATSIQNKDVADAIANDWSQQKVVPFTVTLKATPSPSKWKRKQLSVNVICASIQVGFSTSSSQGTILQESSANNKNPHRQAFTRCSTNYHKYSSP